MKVPKTTLDTVLQAYKPNARFLVEAELEYPKANGFFRIPASTYCAETGHLNAADLVICYNQLAYAFFAEAGLRGLIPELKQISSDEFKARQLGNCFIVGMNRVQFRRQIDTSSTFWGSLELKRTVVKRNGELYFFKTEYDFDNGKATGEIELALVIA